MVSALEVGIARKHLYANLALTCFEARLRRTAPLCNCVFVQQDSCHANTNRERCVSSFGRVPSACSTKGGSKEHAPA